MRWGNYSFTGLEPGVYVVAEILQAGGHQSFPGVADFGLHMFDVESGDVFTGANFGNYRNVAIVGRKLADPDADGVLNQADGLAGWTIYLDLNNSGVLDDGEPTSVTQTDNPVTLFVNEAGLYSFVNLKPGAYTVAEVPQDGYVQTAPAPHADSGRREHRVTLGSNQTLSFRDFGNAPSIEIEGVKWHDLDADGIRDAGEPGLANWTIYLDLNSNGQLDHNEFDQPTEPTAVTAFDDPATENVDETGRYRFEGLLPGSYFVREIVQDGWRQTWPPFAVHVVSSNDPPIVDVNFGNVRTARITGQKWTDLTADGLRQLYDNVPDMPAGDVALANWMVYLDLNNNGMPEANEPKTTTAADDPNTPEDETGTFVFDNLLPGAYVVREQLQPTFVQSLPGDGIAQPFVITLEPGDEVHVEFANVESVSIHGRKWFDLNGDGKRDPNEPGAAGVTIYLDLDRDGVLDRDPNTLAPLEPAITTTADNPLTSVDETGLYWFTDLLPGTYLVAEEIPASWQQTFPNANNLNRHFVALTGGQSAMNVNFANVRGDEGEIHGVKWRDLDGDGVRDPGEPGVVGVTIYADLNNNMMLDAGEPSAVTMPVSPNSTAGDGNQDGLVNDADYLVWRSNFGRTSSTAGLSGDYNGDGRVDAADYAAWRSAGAPGPK